MAESHTVLIKKDPTKDDAAGNHSHISTPQLTLEAINWLAL